MSDLNRDNTDARDMILFGEKFDREKYPGGIRSFDEIFAEDCKKLIELNVIDPDDEQNLAPSVSEIYDFIKKHPTFSAHGYAVSPERPDFRVSFEGVEGELLTMEDLVDFVNLFRYADEFDISGKRAWCWFD